MRFGEDSYENNFLDDFSGYGGYGGLPPVTTYTPPVTTYTPPAATYTPPAATSYAPQSYFDNTQLERNFREETLRNLRFQGGEGMQEKDIRQQAGLGGQLSRPVIDLRSDPNFEGSEFAPGLADKLAMYRDAPLFGIKGSQDTEIGGLFAIPGANYRLISGGKVVGEASTPDEMRALALQATEMGGGRKANLAVQGRVGDGDYRNVFENKPDVNGFGEFLKLAIPIATSFIPGLNILQTMAVAGGSSAGANLLAGESLKKSLLSGAIAAGTAGAMKGIFPGAPAGNPGGSGGLSAVPGAGGMTRIPADAFSSIAQSAADTIPTVLGSRIAQSAIPRLASAAIGAGAGALATAAPRQYEPQPGDEPVLTSNAPRPVPTNVPPIVPAAASDAIRYIVDPAEVAGQIATQPAATEEAEALAEADRIKRFEAEAADAAAAAAAAAAANTGGLSAVEGTVDEALVEADRIKRVNAGSPTNLLASVGDAFVPAEVSGVEGKSLEQEQADPGEKKDSILSKINPARAGISAALGILSALTSGGGNKGRGGSSGNAGAGTRASLDPIFSAKLPAASPQYSGTSFAPRDMSGVDFTRYGYGPGMSFFENVPRNPEEYKAALAANTRPARPSGALNLPPVTMPQTVGGTAADPTASATSLIRTFIPSATDAEIADFLATEEGIQFLANFGAPVRRARGGSMRGTGTSRGSYAVKGAGTGRSDEIPALLSDGEYVMDAETVAMLGDGSSEAGAKRLDDFRVKIRKHKGRNLAKGKFSANAKRPEKYLAGGRA